MISETDIRNPKVQKWCNYCGKVFLGNEGVHEPFCKDCESDEE